MNRFDRAARLYLHEMAVRSFTYIGPEHGHFAEFAKDKRLTPAQERNFKRAVARALEIERRELVSLGVLADGVPFPHEVQALVDEQLEAGEAPQLAPEKPRAVTLPIYAPKPREAKMPDVAEEVGALVRDKHAKS